MTATIFDIKEFSIRDGPGSRTTVFFKGCPLRCKWCHNPEGLSPAPQLMLKESRCIHCEMCRAPCDHEECQPFGRCLHICPQGCITVSGTEWEAAPLAEKILKNRAMLELLGGGVTFSGGEPMLQWQFLLALIPELQGMHTAMETSGFADPEAFRAVCEKLSYVMMDVKLADASAHKAWTGVSNETILENLRWLKKSGIPHEFRTPMIPGATDTAENLAAIEALTAGSKWVKLPYNTLAGSKYPMLGMIYPFKKENEEVTV